MKQLVLKVATVLFALSIVGALVVHASMTSGCSKTEPVKKDEPQGAPVVVSATAVPAVATESAAPVAVTATATATETASVAPPPVKPKSPGANAKNVDIGTSGGFMPASKSGGVFKPQPQQANPPPAQK